MKNIVISETCLIMLTVILNVISLHAEEISFLAYGDSKTAGVGDTTPPKLTENGYPPILAKITGWKELPRIGRGGWTVDYMHNKIREDLKNYKSENPDFVLINLGINDLGHSVATNSRYYAPIYQDEWVKQLGEICDDMKAKWPDVKIGLMRVWGRYAIPTMMDMDDVWMPKVAATRKWVFIGPDERVFLKGTDNGKTLTTDGIHPNHAGYEETAKQWETVVRQQMTGKKTE